VSIFDLEVRSEYLQNLGLIFDFSFLSLIMHSPKKVLFIHHAGVMGGATKSLHGLIMHLDRRRYQPIVYVLRPNPNVVDYLKSDGSLSEARKMANHADTRTTQLYDRRSDAASLDEYSKVGI